MYVFVRIDSEVAENIDGKNKLERLYLYIVKITHFREPRGETFPAVPIAKACAPASDIIRAVNFCRHSDLLDHNDTLRARVLP